MKKPIVYEREYDECVVDGHLDVPELAPVRYVGGYAHHWGGKYAHEFHTIEYQLARFSHCPENKKGCESVWWGFEIGGSISPVAIYKCKHGTYSYGIVSSNS